MSLTLVIETSRLSSQGQTTCLRRAGEDNGAGVWENEARACALCGESRRSHTGRVSAWLGNTESGNNWPGAHRVLVTPWSNVKIAVTSLPARIISGLPGAWPVGRALSQQTVTTENANEN